MFFDSESIRNSCIASTVLLIPKYLAESKARGEKEGRKDGGREGCQRCVSDRLIDKRIEWSTTLKSIGVFEVSKSVEVVVVVEEEEVVVVAMVLVVCRWVRENVCVCGRVWA
jgi:hypothetical protein